ncbi:hypothetical protein F4779DRAFT_599118 [Xylariaceae sp. FL0662B]|nr:hypothetical protein F4779DRAFT_599118 [Xylariaceae sp. FL0662B]
MNSTTLPPDILLLLCEVIAARRDFGSLFRCSLTSRRLASIALEQLYSIQEYSPASTGDAYSKLEWARLWRSIILSSVPGTTAYPYCAYVRALSLGNLEECLHDMTRDNAVRSFFFDGPMDQFLVLRDGHHHNKNTRKAALPLIDLRATMVKCADSITGYIHQLAHDTGTAVALAHLEGTLIPPELVPTWITRLNTLTSLRIRDGSILGVEAASAISQCCPNFVDLTCYYYQSSTADEDLAAFFRTLRPSSLRSFQVISQNGIGENALTALNAHAASLKSLKLGSLPPQAMKSLNMLSGCTALEILAIENDGHNKVDLKVFNEGMLQEFSKWIGKCKLLRELSFTHVLNALPVVKEVLGTPGIRLTSLSVEDYLSGTEAENAATWSLLGSQDRLESLTLGLQDGQVDGLAIGRILPLENSICMLKNLTSLNLMQASVTSLQIDHFVRELPNLSEFSFSGELMDDFDLELLSRLRYLKALSINATSAFEWEGLRNFAQMLNLPHNEGIRVDILNQYGEFKFSDEEYRWLQSYFADKLNGRIEITYFMDPDELHEADFSEFSD